MGIFLIVPTSTHVEPQPFGIVSAQGAASRVMTAAALKQKLRFFAVLLRTIYYLCILKSNGSTSALLHALNF